MTQSMTPPPLAGLGRRLQEAREGLHLDLPVPGYLERLGIDLWVRYRPLTVSVVERLAAGAHGPERLLAANARLLALHCAGIYVVEDGERLPFADDPTAPWPCFDAAVADLLGVSWTSAAQLVTDVYLTERSLLLAADALAAWSAGDDQADTVTTERNER